MDRTVLLKHTRKREIVNNRQIVQYLLRIESKYTLSKMVKFFLMHHATILHSVRVVNDLEYSDTHYRATLKNIIDEYRAKM
jgi:chromosomal replication initiation ATPase DnaA